MVREVFIDEWLIGAMISWVMNALCMGDRKDLFGNKLSKSQDRD